MEIKLTDTENNKYKITWAMIKKRAEEWKSSWAKAINPRYIYGVPRGGEIIVNAFFQEYEITNCPANADVIIDDLIDSGKTEKEHSKYQAAFVALFNKQIEKELKGKWLVLPWEESPEKDIEHHIIRQLEYIGEDANREGLKDTPKRIVKSWCTLFAGYNDETPETILHRTFSKEKHNQIILLKDIELYSTCEHHLLPFFGRCHIGYIPDKHIVGISKLARLMEHFARRMQIQERLTDQIADSLNDVIKPKGVMVVIEAQHFCMTSRGVQKQNSVMMTSAIRGVFEKEKVRDEFMSLLTQRRLHE